MSKTQHTLSTGTRIDCYEVGRVLGVGGFGITYKAFDQGVITDGAGNVIYSLMEQDMVAMRVVARYAFKVFCDDSADGDTLSSGNDYPFAVVRPYTA